MDIKNIVAKVKIKIAEDKTFFRISEIEKFFKDSLKLPMSTSGTFITYDPNDGDMKLFSGTFKGEKASYEIIARRGGHILSINNSKDGYLNFKSAKECFKKIEAIETGKEKLKD